MNATTDTIQDFDLTEIIQGKKRMAPRTTDYTPDSIESKLIKGLSLLPEKIFVK